MIIFSFFDQRGQMFWLFLCFCLRRAVILITEKTQCPNDVSELGTS